MIPLGCKNIVQGAQLEPVDHSHADIGIVIDRLVNIHPAIRPLHE